jgi:hypothetical protein
MDHPVAGGQQSELLGFAQPVCGRADGCRDVRYFLREICFIDQ